MIDDAIFQHVDVSQAGSTVKAQDERLSHKQDKTKLPFV